MTKTMIDKKQDYSGLNDLERAILRGFLTAGMDNVPVTVIKETAKECLAQMKPTEWSKEDEMKREGVIQWLREYQKKFNPKDDSLSIESINSLIDWIKSLPLSRPKSSDNWKPSDEQMNGLAHAINLDVYDAKRYKLDSLYNDLKKLK